MSPAAWLACLALLSLAAPASAQSLFRDGFEALPLVINEIEPSADLGGPDYVELRNNTNAPIDVGNWSFTDDDPTHVYTFPVGTMVPAGGYLVVEGTLAGFQFGLGTFDSVFLYSDDVVLVDRYTWNTDAGGALSHSRCPDGNGPFVRTTPSKGEANVCP